MVTVFNYPNAALRELLMNAVMHRDYQSNMPTRLYLYRSKVEVMNPGGLYGKARPENFPHVNDYRNPVVAEAMKALKYVNMFNHGVRNVQELLGANGSAEAVFNVDYLTVFQVVIEDANVTDAARLAQQRQEKGDSEGTYQPTYIACSQLAHELNQRFKSLILTLQDKEMSIKELQLAHNLLTTCSQLAHNLLKAVSKLQCHA